jgi:hypothetical protein
MKRFCYVRIKLDVKVMLNSKLGIALLASLAYPVLEIVAKLRKDHVTYVGAGHLPDLPEDRECIDHLLMSESKLKDKI